VRDKPVLLPMVVALLLGALLAVSGAEAQRDAAPEGPAETRAALRKALAERDAAEIRSARLEREAKGARDAAERTAREAAALAARIQQAEAGIAAAEARIALTARERATLREELGRQQQPVVELAAALQQFSRRPVALAVQNVAFKAGDSTAEPATQRAMLSAKLAVVDLTKLGNKTLTSLKENLKSRLWSGGSLWLTAFFVAGWLYAFRSSAANRLRSRGSVASSVSATPATMGTMAPPLPGNPS